MEIKDVVKSVEDVAENFKGFKEAQEAELKGLKEKVEASVKSENVAELKTQLGQLDAKQAEILSMLEGNEKSKNDTKSFNDYMAESLKEAAKDLKSIAGSGKGTLGQKGLSIDLKAAGDMSYASNFAGDTAGNITTDFRQSVLQLRERDAYLRNILPQGRTNAASIWYPKHTGGEGAPAIWDATASPRVAKPIFDFDFDSAQANLHWIAGIVKVPREMLDDIDWLESFLRANMLRKLYQAENQQLLNGTGDLNKQLEGIIPIAEAYDGNKLIPIERIVDAAIGQVFDNGHNASHVVLNSRDAVDLLFNKASGSGEYDQPNGVVGYVDGRLTIAGLNVFTAPSAVMTAGQFLTGDFSTSQLVTKLTPELRFFEQNDDDVEKNMITIRIEERVALVNFYDDAYVTGDLAGTVEEEGTGD